MQVEVQAFELAEDFLAVYQGQRPACLVTDLRMRGMSGVELLEALRQRDYTLSVLVMTAYPDTRSTVRAMRGGAINLIEKPCNPQELWTRSSRAAGRRSAFSSRNKSRRMRRPASTG